MSAPPLILASASPQRRDILTRLGVPFEVRPADVEELTDGDPLEVAAENARRKAQAIAARLGDRDGRAILGVDTVVTVDGDVLGKPADAREAAAMLGRLQGRTHRVVSGLVLTPHPAVTEVTSVTFRTLSPAQVDAYVATGEWRGRAGGYAIQERGGALVRRIEGDYLNVVGLPVGALLDLDPSLM
jgi:septum formation protein